MLMHRINIPAWWFSACLITLFGLQIVPWFFASWSTDPYFSHGGLVMLWGLGLAVWRFSSAQQTVHNRQSQGNGSEHNPRVLLHIETLLLPVGGFFLLFGLGLDIASFKAIGWLLSIFGLIRWRLGAAQFRSLRMPLYFTLLAIPWPWSIVQFMALPLQEISSSLARFILDLSGLPVLQEGVVLDSGRFKLVVEETCSGLRSFVAVLTIAIYFMGAGWGSIRQRWMHPLVVLAIILCGNSIRLTTALAIGHYLNHEWAMIWVEDISPFLLIMFETALLLTWLDKPKHLAAKRPKFTLSNTYQTILHALRQPNLHLATSQPGGWRFLGMVFLLVAMTSYAIPGEKSSISLPEWPAPSGWKALQGGGIDASLKEIQQAMQAGAIVRVVRFQSISDPQMIMDGQLIISLGGPGRDVDDPRYCYRSKGWRMLDERPRILSVNAHGNAPEVNEIIEELPRLNIVRLDWFAFRVGNRWVNNYVEFRLYQMLARAMRQMDSIAVVHISTPLRQTGDRQSEIHLARQRLSTLWQTMPLR
ncbi:MAG: exosortase/archaeosortase family protein [Mariprofundaceae bacterium]|nr:exosortase/archaeosortase family protein [Mariprofundaceae bacterium]